MTFGIIRVPLQPLLSMQRLTDQITLVSSAVLCLLDSHVELIFDGCSYKTNSLMLNVCMCLHGRKHCVLAMYREVLLSCTQHQLHVVCD